MMKHLFDNITLKNLKAKNRLVRSATWEALPTATAASPKKLMTCTMKLPKAASAPSSPALPV